MFETFSQVSVETKHNESSYHDRHRWNHYSPPAPQKTLHHTNDVSGGGSLQLNTQTCTHTHTCTIVGGVGDVWIPAAEHEAWAAAALNGCE